MKSIWDVFEKWLSDQKDKDFVSGMDSLAEADLGLARDELQTFMSNRSETRNQLLEMAERFGITEAEIEKERWRALDLTKACGNCSEVSACHRFLLGSGGADGADAFCPNAPAFREMAREKSKET